MSEYKQAFKKAFPYTIPVLTGYLFIGIAFGVMYAEKGYSFLWAILMSVMVYAGSGQYLAVNFFVPGISFIQVIFLTFMVNVRHVFYGISLLERFNKIVKGASEQSKRNIIPRINKPISIKEIPLNDINIIAFEEESSNNQSTLFNLLNKNLNNLKVNVVIGPEGGFSNSEVDYLVKKGYIRVSLGKRILRSETACLDVISKIAFMSEKD